MSAAMRRIFAKLDPGFFRNRKIMKAGRNGRDLFLHVLCMNADHGAPGFIGVGDIEPWYVSHHIGISEAEAQDGVTKAVTAGLIEIREGRVTILGWDSDWSRLPKTDAQRARNYRDKQRVGESSRERHEDNVTARDVSRPSPIRSDQIRSEESRAARDAPDSHASGSDPKSEARTAGRKKASQQGSQSLESDWEPSAEGAHLAEKLEVDLEHEAAQFRDHVKGEGWTSRDWDATFRKWLRGSRDRGKTPPIPKPQTEPQRRRIRKSDGSLIDAIEMPDGTVRLAELMQHGSDPPPPQSSDETAESQQQRKA